MLVHEAEEHYREGLIDLAEGRRREALACFEKAIELDTLFSNGMPQPRYLSHYGLCLALVKNELRQALSFCREAVSREEYNPDLRCNLGRVLMRAGRRKQAHESLIQGLRLEPDHQDLRRLVRSMGVRKRPTLPFLHRKNVLNVWLGRLRAKAA